MLLEANVCDDDGVEGRRFPTQKLLARSVSCDVRSVEFFVHLNPTGDIRFVADPNRQNSPGLNAVSN